jgi:PleD family two-component response regulator
MKSFIDSKGFKRRILIVEDEEINRELLKNILKDKYEILVASNGKEAYDILKNGELKLIEVNRSPQFKRFIEMYDESPLSGILNIS